jgi:ribosomal protein S18 acetylase RimI-like enzyme
MLSTLSNALIEEVYNAFTDSFSDYEVKMDMSIDRFEEMLITRSYSKEFSVGFYDKSILVGFLFIGYRKFEDKKIFYDAGTGVRKKYRRKGIGNELLNEIKKIMKENEINTFLLEVLENNASAIELYKKNGFKIKRRLNCYEISKVIDHDNSINDRIVKNIDIEKDIEKYCSFKPSWQNAYESYLNIKDNYNVINWEKDNKIIGYGIIHKYNGNIMQIGIEPMYRNIETLSKFINGLINRTSSPKLKYLNVEDGSEMDSLLHKLDQKKIVSQYEMIYERK